MDTIYIYLLRDPRNGAVRYVGKANNPTQRKTNHSCRSTSKGLRRHGWIQELRAHNLRPQFEIIEECTGNSWRERERFWIAHYGGIRNLLNARLGGEIVRPASREIYLAMGEKRCGVPRSEETKRRVSESLRGHTVSAETRAKLRAANQAQFSDPKARAAHQQGMESWWANLPEDKKQRVFEGSEHSRRNGIGVKAMQARIASMNEAERADWIARSHAWLSDPINSEKQRTKSLKRWANPAAHIVGPQSMEHKTKTSSSMKSFWASKTLEERSFIARANWKKRRMAAVAH